MPKVLAYDLEFARPLPGGNWKRMTECGVSVLCSWSSEEIEPRVWIPEEGEHVWRDFARHALEHDAYLTWNGIDCDDRMIYAEFPLWAQVLTHGRRLDLCVTAGLYALTKKKGFDVDYLTSVLVQGIPNNHPELLKYKPTAKQAVRNGWSLDPTYANTFGTGSTKSMAGALAPIKWQEGRRGEVIGYCIGDVRRLLDLWQHAWAGKELVNKKGVPVTIPQAVLGAL